MPVSIECIANAMVHIENMILQTDRFIEKHCIGCKQKCRHILGSMEPFDLGTWGYTFGKLPEFGN